jgi:hypothetical protein
MLILGAPNLPSHGTQLITVLLSTRRHLHSETLQPHKSPSETGLTVGDIQGLLHFNPKRVHVKPSRTRGLQHFTLGITKLRYDELKTLRDYRQIINMTLQYIEVVLE